jgi:hypothetical protein
MANSLYSCKFRKATAALAALRASSEPPLSRRLARVVVRPDRPFEFQDFGVLVSVRFV